MIEQTNEAKDSKLNSDELAKAIEIAGYTYDPKQDIFYSNMDPWQRNIGYCRLYDEAAAPMGMIIDCEPIHFAYDGKKWVIEFWKGQYDLVTGCEIGLYTQGVQLNIPGIFKGTFYKSASDSERLLMSCTLKKNGQTLFTREGEHWWLTGFKLGEFSEPSELTMDIAITLKDELMREAFVAGLNKAGYADEALKIQDNTVSLIFDVPHTPQPITRSLSIDKLIQKKNELLCEQYQEMTKTYDNIEDKIKAVKEQAPELYEKVINLGKTKRFYEIFIVVIMIGTLLLSRLASNQEQDSMVL